MPPKTRQRGMSMWGLLGVLIVIGFVLLLAVRLAPVYMDYWSVASIAESVQADADPDEPMNEVWDKVRTRFGLNSLHDMKPREVLTIRRGDAGLEVRVDYEVRRPMLYNIDMIVTFDRTFGA